MRRFLLLLFFPLFSSPINTSPIQLPCITCVDTVSDTTIPDSIKDSIRLWTQEPVDSFRATKTKELQELKEVYDSLSEEIKTVERENKKKLVYRTDTVKGILLKNGEPVIVDGCTVQTIDVWVTYYWRFPDGERLYSHYEIKKIK